MSISLASGYNDIKFNNLVMLLYSLIYLRLAINNLHCSFGNQFIDFFLVKSIYRFQS